MHLSTAYYRSHYYLYLQSSHWKNLKQKYIYSDSRACCWICGKTSTLIIHHVNYENLGYEKTCYRFLVSLRGDIVVLCFDCHTAVHWLTIVGPIRVRVPMKKYYLVKRMKWLRLKHVLRNGGLWASVLALIDCLL